MVAHHLIEAQLARVAEAYRQAQNTAYILKKAQDDRSLAGLEEALVLRDGAVALLERRVADLLMIQGHLAELEEVTADPRKAW